MAAKALGIPSMKKEDKVHLDPARWRDMVASSRAPAGPFQVDHWPRHGIPQPTTRVSGVYIEQELVSSQMAKQNVESLVFWWNFWRAQEHPDKSANMNCLKATKCELTLKHDWHVKSLTHSEVIGNAETNTLHLDPNLSIFWWCQRIKIQAWQFVTCPDAFPKRYQWFEPLIGNQQRIAAQR